MTKYSKHFWGARPLGPLVTPMIVDQCGNMIYFGIFAVARQ